MNEPSESMPLSPTSAPGAERRQTIVMVRSALIFACAYLILFSNHATSMPALGLLVIAAFLASNLVVGRLRTEVIGTQPFNFAIATMDTVFIALSLYSSGQTSVQLIVLLLGVLVLAIAGLRFGVIAIGTLAITGTYLLMLWVGGGAGVLTRSSMLLQVPFLLCAAMVYGWVTEAARMQRSAGASSAQSNTRSLAASLAAQLEAVTRCQKAIEDGSQSGALSALESIAAHNREMQAKVGNATLQAGAAVSAAPNTARTAA